MLSLLQYLRANLIDFLPMVRAILKLSVKFAIDSMCVNEGGIGDQKIMFFYFF